MSKQLRIWLFVLLGSLLISTSLLAEGVITMSVPISEKYIKLSIKANGPVTITGVEESARTDGVSKNYTLTRSTVTIRGDVTELDCKTNRLSSLDVSGCTALTTLDCSSNDWLTSLDVSGCTALTKLYCEVNRLTSLDVSGCTSLTKLRCSYSYFLTSLDLSQNTALTTLDCSGNDRLTSLDVSGCTALTTLECNYNQLTSLDISSCTALEWLSCYSNKLASLDVSKNTALKWLNCNNNQLTSLDVSSCIALTELNCDNNQLTNLDVSGCTALTTLYCYNNQLTSLNVSGCTALTTLNCSGWYYSKGSLTSLDVSGCTALRTLNCQYNQLTSLDVSSCTALTELQCSNNQLTSLEASGCTALTELKCQDNPLTSVNLSGCQLLKEFSWPSGKLTSLDVSGCTSLTKLDCSKNQLTKLEAPGCTALTDLNCQENPLTSVNLSGCQLLKEFSWPSGKLTSLDVSGCTSLTKLDCRENQLTSLDASGCTSLTELSCNSNDPLTSINLSGCQSLKKFSWIEGKLTNLEVSGCTALTTLDCHRNQLTSLDVSSCTALTTLKCYRNQLTSLDVSKNTALTTLDCNYNQLTSLDVSKNTALTTLDCSWNKLTSLDVSKNTALTELDCRENQLTSLDVSGCTALRTLDCSYNHLTSLDVSGGTALTTLKCYRNQLTSLDVSGCTALTILYCYDNQINGEDMTKLVNSLPDRKGMISGTLRMVNTFRDKNWSSFDDVATASAKNWWVLKYVYREGWVSYSGVGEGVITMTTSRAVGEKIGLNIKAIGNFAIEGAQETWETDLYGRKSYRLTSQTITIRGDVTELDCSYNYLDSLNASGCTALTTLKCSSNTLASLNVSGCTALTELNCCYNQLTSLNVSGCTFLTTLDCYNNQLTSLNLSGCTALTELECYENQLTSLDVSGSTALTTLKCYDNQLTSLDMSGCTALTELDCVRNQLTSLDVSKNTALTELDCRENQLTSLDVSGGTALTTLKCYRNQLTSLDVSDCTSLTELGCSSNQLTSLDVSDCTSLTSLGCSNNQLTSLDLSQDTALTTLYCYNNRINEEAMTKLVNSLPDRTGKSPGTFKVMASGSYEKNQCRPSDLAIAKEKNWDSQWSDGSPYSIDIGNGVSTMTTAKAIGETIDLSIKADGDIIIKGVKDTPLPDGKTHRCILTSQTVTILGDVTELKCYDNQLTSLDVSRDQTLTTLVCYKNRINGEAMTQLVNSLPNRTGMSAGTFIVMQNTPEEKNLCRPSDLAIAKGKNWPPQWSDGSFYSIGIGDGVSTMTTAKAIGETIDLSIKANGDIIIKGVKDTPLPDGKTHRCILTSQTVTILGDVTELDCSGNQLTDLDLTRSTALTSLNCSNNQLTSVDLSKITALNTLDCSNNQFANLDLSKNAALNTLDCSNNQLASLDLSKNIALTWLDCTNNMLREVDVSSCTSLKELYCQENQLTSLNVLGCTALTKLTCHSNQLTTLNVSGCTALATLTCYNNQLTSLGVSDCTALATLTCHSNQLTSLDVSGCTALGEIECYNNRINGEKMTNLVNSLPNRKGMTAGVFKVVEYTQSEKNQCRPSDITVAKEKNWNPLEASSETPYIGFGEGVVTMTTAKAVEETISLKIEANGKVIIEGAQETGREDYDSKKLYRLSSQTITIRGDVTELDCDNNQLTSLNVSSCPILTMLYCSQNKLTSLDMSSCIALEELGCSNNQLTSLDVSKNTALAKLECYNNRINGEEMTNLVNSLPNRKGMSPGDLFVVCNDKGEGNWCSLSDVLIARDKNWNTKWQNGDPYKGVGSGVITITTAKAIGETIKLGIKASDAIFIDGVRGTLSQDGTMQSYTLTSKTLTIRGNVIELSCAGNQLTSLDVSDCTSLTKLECNSNQLTSLEASGCTALTTLDCSGNPLTSINLSGCQSLRSFSWPNRELTRLEVSGCTAMTSLDCSGNKLTSLDLSKNVALTTLNCSNNQLSNLNLSENRALKRLNCVSNQLTSLDLSDCTVLTKLYCFKNQLTSLDVSSCIALEELDCYSNQLTSLDVSKNTALTKIECYNNRINGEEMTNLVNSLPNRKGMSPGDLFVVCNDKGEENWCSVSDVLIARGKNWNTKWQNGDPYKGVGSGVITMTTAKAIGETIKLRVKASDAIFIEGVRGTLSQDGTMQSYTLTSNTLTIRGNVIELSCAGSQLTSLDVSNCTSLISLNCQNNELTSLDVSSCISLTSLNCQANKLASLDVSKNSALTTLDCNRNQLSSLKVSGCTVLTTLNCASNNLESLPLLACINLTELNCEENQLTGLNLFDCKELKSLYCIKNKLNGKAMSSLIESLPDRTGRSEGRIKMYSEYVVSDETFAYQYDVRAAQKKNWKLFYNDSTPYKGAPNPICSVTKSVEGKGYLSITGAIDLGVVAYGTKLTVVATPKANYELVSLTANGVDILATKEFVVKEDVTVEAVFSGHTFNVALEKEGAGELIAVGLDDTHEAAYGTELTIVATPAADYELTALTANGRDILATKKVVVTENMTIKATFAKKSFAVSLTKEGEGTITATGASNLNAVAYGTELTINATPAKGYELVSITANGTDITATKKIVVKENLTVKATFAKKAFAVSLTKEGEGTITATGASNLNAVAYGTELTINATPAMGYELVSITAGGTDITASKKVVVTGNLTIKATFAKKNFAVSLTKEGEGAITATGASNLNSVAYGTELTINATPAKGYELVSITANGTDITATKKIVVKDNLTVKATFAKKNFAVSLTKEGEGTITATGATSLNAVAYGTELTIVATPAKGYELTALTANGTDILATKKVVVTDNMTVKATFAKKSFAVSLTKEGEGTITATGASSLNAVAYGTELTINATPAEGYELTALTANGTDILASKKVIVKEAVEVKATFAKKSFAVSLTKEGEGAITATGATSLNAVAYGTELTIVATPAEGYELTALTANGTDILASKKVIVKEAVEVKATFEKKTFAVTLTSNDHGDITIAEPVDLKAVPYGTTLTVKATGKNAQCVLTELTANGEDILATRSFVVADVTEVKATFVDHTGVERTVTQQTQLYPNPATDYVIVEGVAAASEVTLHSMTGERLYAGRADSRGTLQIDLTPYADGVYLVCVAGDTYRVVVRH